jgi:hypothetical protein
MPTPTDLHKERAGQKRKEERKKKTGFSAFPELF